ncbi:MAG: hypothetical protein PHG35_09380 [Dehalococcoidales bacterium]|nr:hypothetical protein [Dehalococcoidales bacterium]
MRKYLLVLVLLIPVLVVTGANYVFRSPSDWNSVTELREFLAQDDGNERVYLKAGRDGRINFNGACEDRAFKLRDNALEQGKRLEAEILTYAETIRYKDYIGITYEELCRLTSRDSHMIVKAYVDNEIWYIEPSNDRIWHTGYLD